VSTRQLTREQILALPPAISLVTLAECLSRSEPVIRAALRAGELERLGIKVNKLGAKYLVVTSSVWDYLGITPPDRASTVPPGGNDAGRRKATAPARGRPPRRGQWRRAALRSYAHMRATPQWSLRPGPDGRHSPSSHRSHLIGWPHSRHSASAGKSSGLVRSAGWPSSLQAEPRTGVMA
jgi:hypothetical protein